MTEKVKALDTKTAARVRYALESQDIDSWHREVTVSGLGENIDFFDEHGRLMISVRITPIGKVDHANFMFNVADVNSNNLHKIIKMLTEIREAIDDAGD